MFLRHGSLLDSKTKDNDQTPLHLACQYNQKDVSRGGVRGGARTRPACQYNQKDVGRGWGKGWG